MRHVQRYGQVRVNGVGGHGCALGAHLLLGGGYKVDIADMAHFLQPLGRLQKTGHTGAVVHGLGGAAIVEQGRRRAVQGNEVAYAHLRAHLIHRQPQVHEQIFPLVVVLAVGGAEQMRRGGPHHAQQLCRAVPCARSVHGNGGGRQDARVHAAHLPHAQRAVRQNVRHHEGDFVLMRRQHHAGRRRSVLGGRGGLFQGNHVVERIDGHAVAQRLKARLQPAGHLRLVPAGAVLHGHALQIVQNVHCSLPFPVG